MKIQTSIKLRFTVSSLHALIRTCFNVCKFWLFIQNVDIKSDSDLQSSSIVGTHLFLLKPYVSAPF